MEESRRGSGRPLAGTGEVGLMGFHADEIIDHSELPITCTTADLLSAGGRCRRQEHGKTLPGAPVRQGRAGRDPQANEEEHRAWHGRMISFVETLLQRLELPTDSSGAARVTSAQNEDMIDIECWIPCCGADGPDGRPTRRARPTPRAGSATTRPVA